MRRILPRIDRRSEQQAVGRSPSAGGGSAVSANEITSRTRSSARFGGATSAYRDRSDLQRVHPTIGEVERDQILVRGGGVENARRGQIVSDPVSTPANSGVDR